MEEFVGQVWHKYINKWASREFPEARVFLDDNRSKLATQFRALGGDLAFEVKPALEKQWQGKRSWLSRIADNQEKQSFASTTHESILLPKSIAVFPNKKDNEKLYFWLIALLANYKLSNHTNWLEKNLNAVNLTLKQFPGIRKTYSQLATKYVAIRKEYFKTNPPENEIIIEQFLLNPDSEIKSEISFESIYPVALWTDPTPTYHESSKSKQRSESSDSSELDEPVEDAKQLNLHKKADSVEDIDGKDGLMAFRLESIFSWNEFVPVDRTADDDDQDDAAMAAEDINEMSVVRNEQSSKTRLKFDLDLPSEDQDDIVLGDGIKLPEWDYRKSQLQEDHCRLQLMEPRDVSPHQFPAALRSRAKRLRDQFESLTTQKQWLKAQPDGSEIDLEQYLLMRADQSHGDCKLRENLYIELKQNLRSLSCLLLADLSLSTETHVDDEHKVIDLIKDSLYLFSESLSATQDRFAISGFSSKRRDMIRYYPIKKFEENHSKTITDKIASLTPGYYTRMGAAIRYATEQLQPEPSEQKLLLLLSDGKPNDVDIYESRYGIEDTRHAVSEAFKKGIRVFCITIDDEASSYPGYIFGVNNFLRIQRTIELPEKLPKLYSLLTQ